MRIKIERTDAGKVKSVQIKKKNAKYGEVTKEDAPYSAIAKAIEADEEGLDQAMEGINEHVVTSGTDGTVETGESTGEVENSQPESISDQPEASEEQVKEGKEEEKENLASEQDLLKSLLENLMSPKEEPTDGSGEESKESKQEKPKDEMLTRYLTLTLQLKALAELTGAVTIAEVGNKYYSFMALESTTSSDMNLWIVSSPIVDKKYILGISTFPWFKTAEQAEAFRELCAPVLNEYIKLLAHLNPMAIVGRKLKVIPN